MHGTWSYSSLLGLANAQSIMYIQRFKLYDIRRFDSTVVINVLINLSCLRLNNQLLYKLEVYCMNMLQPKVN